MIALSSRSNIRATKMATSYWVEMIILRNRVLKIRTKMKDVEAVIQIIAV